MKTLYSAFYTGDGYPFNHIAEEVVLAKNITDLQEKDSALVIWGGADISPDLYKHPHSRTTYPSQTRDPIEWALLHQAIKLGIPIIGVCRGAQMLCAAAGGFLIQDVSNHHGSHMVHTYDGTIFNVNSIHHQMMAGYEKVSHKVLAWCDKPRSKSYLYRDDEFYQPPEDFKEPEMIWFPKIKGMAIQWHPEGMAVDSPASTFIFGELNAYGIQ